MRRMHLPLNWCKMVNESCRLVGYFDRLIYSFPNYHLNKFSWMSLFRLNSFFFLQQQNIHVTHSRERGHWFWLAVLTSSGSEHFSPLQVEWFSFVSNCFSSTTEKSFSNNNGIPLVGAFFFGDIRRLQKMVRKIHKNTFSDASLKWIGAMKMWKYKN